MPLNNGDRLGPYEILAPLGAGGMGEVYRARDTRLDRTVAVKVLPSHFASDATARERFDREARAVAALNHPNICVLHDVGEHSSSVGPATAFLVMEHLEGETLAARIARGPLPMAQALAIAVQIADALDKAHRHGIIHRDLKPGNVILAGKVGGSGPPVAKLLDFGLAKLRSPSGSASPLSAMPTEGTPLTAAGAILGTYHYMAPEQIEGADADSRTDLFAFGVVLYEMITGRRAFDARTQAGLLGAILKDQPPPISDALPGAPPALEQLLHSCLAKDPDERIQTAHDLLLQLRWIAGGSGQASVPAAVHVKRAAWRRYGAAAAAIGVLGVAGTPAVLYYRLLTRPQPAPLIARFGVALAEPQNFTRTGRHVVAVSPDGRYLAYVANSRLYLRPVDRPEAEAIRGSDIDPIDPVFSPDGEWIAFNAGASELKKVPVTGGTAVTLAKMSLPYGIGWSGHGIFVGLGQEGVVRVSPNGGVAEVVVKPENEATYHGPQVLPDGRTLLFTRLDAGSTQWDDGTAMVAPVGGGSAEAVFGQGRDFRYIDSGHLVFARAGTVFGVRFDLSSLKVIGGPVPLVEEVMNGFSGSQYAVSSTGLLAYVTGSTGEERSLVWVDRSGRATPIAAERRSYEDLALSPDGTRIAVSLDPQPRSVWIQDVARGTFSRLTMGTGRQDPLWTVDGTRVVFDRSEAPAGLFWQPADGSGPEERLTSGVNDAATSVSPDGRSLIIARSGDIYLLPLASADRSPVALVKSAATEGDGRVSPDARWLAYTSNETGRSEIYVRPFPRDGGRWQVSVNGGTDPHWNPNGRELFFRNATDVLAVNIAPGSAFSADSPRILFSGSYLNTGIDMGYASRTDRFVMIQTATATQRPTISVVLNWFQDVRRRVN